VDTALTPGCKLQRFHLCNALHGRKGRFLKPDARACERLAAGPKKRFL